MRRRITRLLVIGTLSASLAICLGTMLGADSAKLYRCQKTGCSGDGFCTGDLYDRQGCRVVCFRIVGGDEIESTGEVDCQPLMD